MRILGCGVYFCWVSGLMSAEKHVQSRLEPRPAPASPGLHNQEVLLPPIVVQREVCFTYANASPQFHLIIISWRFYWWAAEATLRERNCELTISKSLWRLLLPTSLWILWRWQTNVPISPHSSLLSDGSLAAEPSWPLLSSCVHFSYAPTSSLLHRLQKAE